MAVIFDEAGVHPDAFAAEEVLRNAGLAVPVFVNSALMATGRIMAEVRGAMARIARERKIAVRQAEALLRNDLKSEITGILIAAQLALESHELSLSSRKNSAASSSSQRACAAGSKWSSSKGGTGDNSAPPCCLP